MKHGRYAQTPCHARSVHLFVHFYHFIGFATKGNLDSTCVFKPLTFHPVQLTCTRISASLYGFGRKGKSVAGVVVVGIPVHVHVTEIVAVARIRRTIPPVGANSLKPKSYLIFLYLCLSESITPFKSFIISFPLSDICSICLLLSASDLYAS